MQEGGRISVHATHRVSGGNRRSVEGIALSIPWIGRPLIPQSRRPAQEGLALDGSRRKVATHEFHPSMKTRSLLLVFLCCWSWALLAADRPNIIWIVGEDLGPELGCYGD